jgi:hypothetical protein
VSEFKDSILLHAGSAFDVDEENHPSCQAGQWKEKLKTESIIRQMSKNRPFPCRKGENGQWSCSSGHA